MAVDPLKNVNFNRATQIKREGNELGKGVRLYDVDLAIAEHMIDTVVPSVEALSVNIISKSYSFNFLKVSFILK